MEPSKARRRYWPAKKWSAYFLRQQKTLLTIPWECGPGLTAGERQVVGPCKNSSKAKGWKQWCVSGAASPDQPGRDHGRCGTGMRIYCKVALAPQNL